MKIGVATITGGANYGNRLQNYAMLKTMEKLGFEAENVKKSVDLPLPLVLRAKRFVMKTLKIRNFAKINRQDKFKKFDQKNLAFSKKIYTHSAFDPDDYKAVVCGSDQVWNLDFDDINKEIGYYFASFVPENKRVAFSASIGVDAIPQDKQQIFCDYINSMAHISVRENQGAKIIKDLTGRDVAVTVDPTLMLDEEHWRAFARKPAFVDDNQKYILSYFLGDVDKKVIEYMDSFAKANGCTYICLEKDRIMCPLNEKWFAADPAEFVWLIANSHMFFTDSFHGCVFATVFKKAFRWFSRIGGFSKNMNSRMETLFDKLCLGDWCIGDINEPQENLLNCDFSRVDENLAKEREFAYNYLKEALK